jgi:hypothetical protein
MDYCPPEALSYQSGISAGGAMIVWGGNFSVGGNQIFLTPANGGSTVALNRE